MTRARAAALTIVAGGCAVVLHVALSVAGADPFHPAVAAAACVALASTAVGGRGGAAAGLLAGAALAWVRWRAGVGPGGEDALRVVSLASVGGAVGLLVDRLRLRLEESAASELAARRESYQLRREVEALGRERDALAEGGGAGDAPDAAAPDAAAEESPDVPSAATEVDVRLEQALRRIASALNEARLFATALESIAALVGAARVSLHLHDRRADRFQPGTCFPVDEPVPPFDREPVLRRALRQRELLAREDGAEEFRLVDSSIRYVAPVFDRVILAGLIVVEGGEETPGARERLSILVTAFGLALSSVRLVGQLERRDRTDLLTGLPSVTEIREQLGRSLERGRTAVLLVAADGIRDVNEKYGRKAGDKAVQALSKLLALEVGADGKVGRYGGATMLVVLPGVERDAAVQLAERVLQYIADVND
ncbi:MAG: GGDEF domain-containing protein, partial [Planctomycetota bacterium JB042]